MVRQLSVIAAILLSAGCAGVVHKRVTDDARDKGIRYYGTSLYLLVHTDGKEGLVVKILELPDPTKLMSAKPHSFMSSLSLTMDFKNGALAKANATADSAIVVKELVAAAEAVATSAAATALGPQAADGIPVVPGPSLWKIVPTADYFLFHGEQNAHTIRINRKTQGGP